MRPLYPYGDRSATETANARLQDFMIQGGDPTGTGRGGSSIYGYAVLDGDGR